MNAGVYRSMGPVIAAIANGRGFLPVKDKILSGPGGITWGIGSERKA
jgi:hypothetical protein